jgi:hypothetical protein
MSGVIGKLVMKENTCIGAPRAEETPLRHASFCPHEKDPQCS